MGKVLDLKMPGVTSLKEKELRVIEGGSFLGALVTVAVVAAALYIGKWLGEKLCNCDE